MAGKGRKQDQQKRRLLRRRLEKLGYRPDQIERRVAALDRRRAAMHEAREHSQRHGRQQDELTDPAQAAAEEETYARLSPDDSKFRPSKPDPLKTGAARATGMTAKVAGRKGTITKWQYDAEVAR